MKETKEITITLWVRIKKLKNARNSILHSENWNKNGLHLFWIKNLSLKFCVNGSRPSDMTISGGDADKKFKNWAHQALTYNSKKKRVICYIDGEKTSEQHYKQAVDIDLNKNFWIGGWNKQNRFFNGSMDDIRLYDRELSKQEIEKIKNREEIKDSLMAWWTSENISKQTVLDNSGNKHNAKMLVSRKKLKEAKKSNTYQKSPLYYGRT